MIAVKIKLKTYVINRIMEAKLYQLKSGFAKHNNLMVYFVAKELFSTQKAVYLYGHGTTETTKFGVCCCCGRGLTHPVSVELGIGPICGGHFHDWNAIGGYTLENIARLKGALVNTIFDHWVPKSQIEKVLDSSEIVDVPADHPTLLRQKNEDQMKANVDALNAFVVQANASTYLEDKVKSETMINPTRPFLKPSRVAEIFEQKGSSLIKIVFPYHIPDIEKVKSLLNRRFLPDLKCWSVPITSENVKLLKEWGFSLSAELESVYEQSKPENQVRIDSLSPIEIPGLKGDLFPFQRTGVSFIDKKSGRALVADEMGLGKTVQALAYLQLHPELRPAIIVTPASLKLNWNREASKWMEKPRCEVLSGTTPYTTHGEILIVNYDILTNWVPFLKVKSPKVLIMDEVHSIKNSSAKRTKAAKLLAKSIPHIIGLSGTPIVNRPIEIYNALSIINSMVIPNFKEYTRKFCGAKYNGFGWDFNGATNTDELHKLLVSSFMIRRLKKDVLKDLPPKIKSFVPMELDNEKEYRVAEDDFIDYLRGTKGHAAAERASNAAVLAEINGLKQLAVAGKLKQCINWIEDFLESGEKLVAFTWHRATMEALYNHFPNISVKVEGGMSDGKRDQAVTRFQEDPTCRLFFGQIKAAGEGLTLTASSNVAILELPWTPGGLSQCEDRCHRIGQKDSVTIHYLLAAGTIEEKIARLLDGKQLVLDAVLDGTQSEEASLLMALINEYKS